MQSSKSQAQMTFPDLSRAVISCAWPFGFVFLIMWRVLIVRQNAVDHGGINIHLLFYGSFGAAALLVVLLCIFARQSSWRSRQRTWRSRQMPILALCAFSMACMLVSTCALTLDIFSGSRPVAILGAVVGGVATISGMLGWGSYYKGLPLQVSITYILVAYMADFLLMPVCHLLFPTAIIPVLLFFSIAAPFCLLMSQRPQAASATGPVEASATGTAGLGLQERQASPSFWRLLGAFAIYSFVLTLRRPATSDSDELARFILSCVALAVTLLLFWLLVVRRSRLPFERILQLFFLAFAIGFFFSPFSTGMLYEVLSALLSVTTGLIFMLVWAAAIDVAHSSSIHPFVVIGAWGACYGCPRLLLVLVDAVLTQLGYSIDTGVVASLLSLFGLFVAFFLISRQPSAQPSGVRPFFFELRQPSSHDNLELYPADADWAGLAHEHGLTERESEIFILICKGHSNRHIAKHLHISENTVKAHKKKIYAKTGVHSKSELEERIWSG